jgi:hypothetical protein
MIKLQISCIERFEVKEISVLNPFCNQFGIKPLKILKSGVCHMNILAIINKFNFMITSVTRKGRGL